MAAAAGSDLPPRSRAARVPLDSRKRQWSQSSPHGEHPVCADGVLREVTELSKDRETPRAAQHRTPLAGTREPVLSAGPREPAWGGWGTKHPASTSMRYLPPGETPPATAGDPRIKFLRARSHTRVLLEGGSQDQPGSRSPQRLAGSPRTES